MTGAELLDGLHDGYAESLVCQWQQRTVSLRLIGQTATLAVHARGVTQVSWTHESPWGESKTIRINEVETRVAFGRDVLEMQMSTGDRLLIEAREIDVVRVD